MNLTKYCGVWFFNVYNLIKGSTLHLPICITVLLQSIVPPTWLEHVCDVQQELGQLLRQEVSVVMWPKIRPLMFYDHLQTFPYHLYQKSTKIK